MPEQNNAHPTYGELLEAHQKRVAAAYMPDGGKKALEEYAAERQQRLAQGERPAPYAGGVSIVRTRG